MSRRSLYLGSRGVLAWLVACATVPAVGACGNKGEEVAAPLDTGVLLDAADTADTADTADAQACDFHLGGGFTEVTPATSATDASLGLQVSMAFDENQDPLFAYVSKDAQGSYDLWFLRWERCKGTWTTPVQIDTLGAISANGTYREVSIAYDASTKEVAIGYQKVATFSTATTSAIYLATAIAPACDAATCTVPAAPTFRTQLLSEPPAGSTSSAGTPSVAMHGGQIYVAYAQKNQADCGRWDGYTGLPSGCTGLYFMETTSAPPGDAGVPDAGAAPHAFARTVVQYVEGTCPGTTASALCFNAEPRFDAISVAVDLAGTPAVAFFEAPNSHIGTYDTQLLYWKKGTQSAVLVTDSANIQNDRVDVTLAFEGTSPRVAGHLVAANASSTPPRDYDLTFVASDDGTAWGTPVRLPRVPGESTAFTSALAFDGLGLAAVGAEENSGNGTDPCAGNPYLARFGSRVSKPGDPPPTWSACSADVGRRHSYVADAMNAIFGASRVTLPDPRLGTFLTLAFHNGKYAAASATAPEQRMGIIYWRE